VKLADVVDHDRDLELVADVFCQAEALLVVLQSFGIVSLVAVIDSQVQQGFAKAVAIAAFGSQGESLLIMLQGLGFLPHPG